MNIVTGVYFKVLLVLLLFSVIALVATFLGAFHEQVNTWYFVVLPLAGGPLGWIGGEVAMRKGWLVRCEGRRNCYRPKSMLLAAVMCVVMLACAIVLVGVVLFILAS